MAMRNNQTSLQYRSTEARWGVYLLAQSEANKDNEKQKRDPRNPSPPTYGAQTKSKRRDELNRGVRIQVIHEFRPET